MGCSPWGRKESDTTEQFHSLTHSMFPCMFFLDMHVVLVLLNAHHYLYLQIKK